MRRRRIHSAPFFHTRSRQDTLAGGANNTAAADPEISLPEFIAHKRAKAGIGLRAAGLLNALVNGCVQLRSFRSGYSPARGCEKRAAVCNFCKDSD